MSATAETLPQINNPAPPSKKRTSVDITAPGLAPLGYFGLDPG